jgi:hypothetical protein
MGFYRKNIGGWYQWPRIVVGLAATGAAFHLLDAPMSYIGIAAGLAFAATGIVGYCPMCAVAGLNLRK